MNCNKFFTNTVCLIDYDEENRISVVFFHLLTKIKCIPKIVTSNQIVNIDDFLKKKKGKNTEVKNNPENISHIKFFHKIPFATTQFNHTI